mgnify:CR=1 FL=1
MRFPTCFGLNIKHSISSADYEEKSIEDFWRNFNDNQILIPLLNVCVEEYVTRDEETECMDQVKKIKMCLRVNIEDFLESLNRYCGLKK